MIKIFRQIRQRMIKENKFSKYLLYAIGEIVLVVIGILIALNLNMQRERQKSAELGLGFLAEMKHEVQEDVFMLADYSYMLKANITEHEAALRTKVLDKLPHDSVFMIISPINLDLAANDLTFNKMKNIGLTALSENEALNAQINSYYNARLVSFKRSIAYVFEEHKKYLSYLQLEDETLDVTFRNFSEKKHEFPSIYEQPFEEHRESNRLNGISFIRSSKGRKMILSDLESKRYSQVVLREFQKDTEKLLRAIHAELFTHEPSTEALPLLPSEMEDLEEISMSQETLKRYVGKYEGEQFDVIDILLEEGHIYVQPRNYPKYEMFPYAEDRFFSKAFRFRMQFTRENDKVMGLTLPFRGEEYYHSRVE